MSKSVPEKDWKLLRSVKDELLESACDRILIKLQSLIDKKNDNKHQIYLKIWKTLNHEDRKISEMFDDMKRSNAIFKIAALANYHLINAEILSQFSEKTQESVRIINDMQH